jgi:SH3-like domain-containing protein
VVAALIVADALAAPALAAAPERATPYWASISAGKARTRTGPGRNYPAIWLYRRADLPVRVVEVFPSWRKIEDPDGAQGWVMVNLLSEKRTAIIIGGTQPLRKEPGRSARVVWEAETGVVGRISGCTAGWCRFDVKGRGGYVEMSHLWGVNPGEVVE